MTISIEQLTAIVDWAQVLVNDTETFGDGYRRALCDVLDLIEEDRRRLQGVWHWAQRYAVNGPPSDGMRARRDRVMAEAVRSEAQDAFNKAELHAVADPLNQFSLPKVDTSGIDAALGKLDELKAALEAAKK